MVANILETNRLWHYFENLENLFSKAVHVHKGKNRNYWRERLFSTIFFPIIICGFFVYAPTVVLCIKMQQWPILAVDTIVYLIVVIITLFRNIPYILRAGLGVTIFWSLGLFLLILNGPISSGQVWLFTFPVLTGVLLGARKALIALSINICTLFIIGIFIHRGVLIWDMVPAYNFEIWIVDCLNFLFDNIIVTLSLAILFQGLQKSLAKEESMTEKLNQEHNVLLETNEHLKREIHERELA